MVQPPEERGRILEMSNLESKLESIYHRKFNRTPVLEHKSQDCHTLTGFIREERRIIKFVDWTRNTAILRTDVTQPLYLTDPEAHADTYEDRCGLFLAED